MSYRREQKERDRRDPRGAEMADLYRSRWTMGAIGALYGLSDARVKDLLMVHMPAEERRAIKLAEIADRAAERKAQRLLAELLRRCAEASPCIVCGAWVLRKTKRTCSPECATAWMVGRYQLDDEYREKHRVAQARTILATVEKQPPHRIEWARRMLSDDPPPPNRRFAWAGSAASRVAEQVGR